jgi:ABC-2 type transport system ATP-binding protein
MTATVAAPAAAGGARVGPDGSPPVVIRTRGLAKLYGAHVAVRGLDLEVHAGEVFGLLGPNGAGKTTTILMLLGLSEPTGGTAEVLGLDPARNPLAVKRFVGYLPDAVGFYRSLSGRENLRYTCRLNGIERKDAERRITAALERVGLRDAGEDLVDTYSRGMLQRLGLADALVKDPLVLILDEPTTSIDPMGVLEVLELVRQLAHEQGVAVLLSSHLLHQVQQVCDRMAIFVSGEVVAMGTVAELAARQEHGVSISLEVGADGDAGVVADVLRGVPGVSAVERDPVDHRLWRVTAAADARGPVVDALVRSGHVPWLLRDRGMELDEVYRRYFVSGPDGGATGRAAGRGSSTADERGL